jgi:tRNA threonylcarbamoyl adenosine modification protein (Sua5/YciO/YrdC/YwlC family)
MTPSVQDISDAFGSGAVVGIPTDTVYGIAADPRNPIAVGRLFSIKERSEGKPVGLLVADIDSALEMVELPEYAVEWTRSFWPGPLNLVGVARFELPEGVGDRSRGTVGVRVPNHVTTREILSAFGPLAVTSANRSGAQETLDDTAARAALGDLVDMYVAGRCPGAVSSTTIDVTGLKPVLLRQGPLDLGLRFEPFS